MGTNSLSIFSKETIAHTVAVDSVHLLQQVMVVADPFRMKQKFGSALRFHEAADEMSTQSKI